MQTVVLKNARIFDGYSADLLDGGSVAVETGRIKEVSDSDIALADAQHIDCGGRFLMPGLIDAHFHAYTPTVDIIGLDRMPSALISSHAASILEGTLQRGFTTVRDAGGADIGLWLAIEQGLIEGPRLFYSGKAISQTGGHGDQRAFGEVDICACGTYSGTLSIVADGADAVRRAVREELRKGATQIKILLSGGIFSKTAPLWLPQLTDEEVSAAVYEASTRRTYVMAHCHTDEGARRCVKLGVRSIEHGSMIGAETARMIADAGTFVVPTLSVVDVLRKHGADLGFSGDAMAKVNEIYGQMLHALEVCVTAGAKVALGADLLGNNFHPMQGGELELRGEVQPPIDVLRAATSVNAELLQQTGKLGTIAPDAYADIILIDGDPLKDLGLFRRPDESIPFIMRGGKIVKNIL
jgi:imidazolonepropionase-like amidohydrolase